MLAAFRTAATIALILFGSGSCWAQTTGSHPATFVVSFAAGGAADVIARVIALRLGDRFGRKIVVENRAGAGGNLAARMVTQAQPDGATILVTTSALAVNDTASRNKGYATEDLRAIAVVASSPDIVAVHPSNPAKTIGDFVRNVRGKSFTYGTPGAGTSPAIAAEYFFREVAKVDGVQVPFQGGAPVVSAGIGNHIDLVVASVPTASAQINEGSLRGIGIPAATRNSSVPDVPTYAEGGFPNFISAIWVGFFAPAKTPDAVVGPLNAEINEILKEPDVQQKLKTLGFDPMLTTPPEAAAFLKSEVERWGKMSRAIGFSID